MWREVCLVKICNTVDVSMLGSAVGVGRVFPKWAIVGSQWDIELVHRWFPWACHEGAVAHARKLAKSEHMMPVIERGRAGTSQW